MHSILFLSSFAALAAAAPTGTNGNAVVTAAPAGYDTPIALPGAINAPLDALGSDTYLGTEIYKDMPFSIKLCADACTRKSQYAIAHPPKDGPAVTCQFFNTYMSYIGDSSNPEAQYCSMYSEAWNSSYATNNGQWRGSVRYLIGSSYAVSNATDAGCPRPEVAASQASKDIAWRTLQPYCSSIIPTVCSSTTVLATSTILPVATVTDFLTTTVGRLPIKRDDATATDMPTLPLLDLSDDTYSAAQLATNLSRRAIAVPNVLTKYPSSIILSACSKFGVATVTSVSTTTSTTTVTGGYPTATTTVTIVKTVISVTTAAGSATSVSATSGASTDPTASATPFVMQVHSGKAAGSFVGPDSSSGRVGRYSLFALTTEQQQAIRFTLGTASSDGKGSTLLQGDWEVEGVRARRRPSDSFGAVGASSNGFDNGETLACSIDVGALLKDDGTKADLIRCWMPESGDGVAATCGRSPRLWLFDGADSADGACPTGSGPLVFRAVAV